ncbi:hypothetical protein IFR09_13975 [Pseudomonas syringae]|nr:hypothetical protein [Pseudomonas syringae]MBD8789702.1 hypothetical protein [Pseudomonas syringae]MBD8800891.1 hypothetical protein [Pseudomonas syringae]MBD8812272.1 hypothetical protein [Pseudomonas syringae]
MVMTPDEYADGNQDYRIFFELINGETKNHTKPTNQKENTYTPHPEQQLIARLTPTSYRDQTAHHAA